MVRCWLGYRDPGHCWFVDRWRLLILVIPEQGLRESLGAYFIFSTNHMIELLGLVIITLLAIGILLELGYRLSGS